MAKRAKDVEVNQDEYGWITITNEFGGNISSQSVESNLLYLILLELRRKK